MPPTCRKKSTKIITSKFQFSRGTSREFTKLQAKESQPKKGGGGFEHWGTETTQKGIPAKKGKQKGCGLKGSG